MKAAFNDAKKKKKKKKEGAVDFPHVASPLEETEICVMLQHMMIRSENSHQLKGKADSHY